MQNLLTSQQTREADAYTIAQRPITSIDLMERAARAFTSYFVNHFSDKSRPIVVVCGTGNNGGDGLAIARMLAADGYMNTSAIVTRFSEKASADFATNFSRLKNENVSFTEIKRAEDASFTIENLVLVDALLGSGLNKPLRGEFEILVNKINALNCPVVSVDVPTGFYTDAEPDENTVAIHSDLTIAFQRPKLNFFLPESKPFIKKWEVVEIGLDENFIQQIDSAYKLIDEKGICAWLKPRHDFDHKGTFGHALLIAGAAQTMGAALLSAEACLYTGAGLTTVCIPPQGLTALNTRLPEVMAVLHGEKELPDIDWKKFSAIAVGPGLGTDDAAAKLLHHVIANRDKPTVADADALNILSTEKDWQKKLGKGTILTPHRKEFDRLFGEHKNWWQRVKTGQAKAKEYGLNIVLKNRYTFIFTPEGLVYINTTGNPAMATGGMGDTLTGVIVALLAQGYGASQAAIIAVYLHGKTADELAFQRPRHLVLPTQVSEKIPLCLGKMLQKKDAPA